VWSRLRRFLGHYDFLLGTLSALPSSFAKWIQQGVVWSAEDAMRLGLVQEITLQFPGCSKAE
jgi:hypothetical protein